MVSEYDSHHAANAAIVISQNNVTLLL